MCSTLVVDGTPLTHDSSTQIWDTEHSVGPSALKDDSFVVFGSASQDRRRGEARGTKLMHNAPTDLLAAVVPIRLHFEELEGVPHCDASRFHWNGFELVICAIGSAPWSGLDNAVVTVFLPFEHEQAGRHSATAGLEFVGLATADTVSGVAPEYRAAAVRYLGTAIGHQESDALDRELATNKLAMHRLFITPTDTTFAGSPQGAPTTRF